MNKNEQTPGSSVEPQNERTELPNMSIIGDALKNPDERLMLTEPMFLSYHVQCAASDQQISADRIMNMMRGDDVCVMVGNNQHMVNIEALTDESMARLTAAVANQQQMTEGTTRLSALMDDMLTDRIDLHGRFGVERKLHDGQFGDYAVAVIRKDGQLYLSDDRNRTLPVSSLKEGWLMNDLVNMAYSRPLTELLRDGEQMAVDIVADNSLSSMYAVDEYYINRISRHGDMIRVDGQRNMITQSDMEKGETYLNVEHEMTPIRKHRLPVGCSYAVYEQLKPLIEEKRQEEKTFDSISYDGKTWPLRKIVLPETGQEVLIGTVGLEQALLPDDGRGWKDSTAEAIDMKIFFYVDDDQINLPSKELVKPVEHDGLDIDDLVEQLSDFRIAGHEGRDNIFFVESGTDHPLRADMLPSYDAVHGRELFLGKEEAGKYSDMAVTGIDIVDGKINDVTMLVRPVGSTYFENYVCSFSGMDDAAKNAIIDHLARFTIVQAAEKHTHLNDFDQAVLLAYTDYKGIMPLDEKRLHLELLADDMNGGQPLGDERLMFPQQVSAATIEAVLSDIRSMKAFKDLPHEEQESQTDRQAVEQYRSDAMKAIVDRADSTSRAFTSEQAVAIDKYLDAKIPAGAVTKGDEIHHRHLAADELYQSAQPDMDRLRIYPEWRQEAKADLDILADGMERYEAKIAQDEQERQGGPAR